jgi:hypothetical protein
VGFSLPEEASLQITQGLKIETDARKLVDARFQMNVAGLFPRNGWHKWYEETAARIGDTLLESPMREQEREAFPPRAKRQ